MAVVLANAQLAVARKTHPFARDAHGAPVAAREQSEVGPFRPGAIKERAANGAEQGPEWSIRLDPDEWPVKIGDHITEEGGDRVWNVTAALLQQVPGVPDVDYIGVTATLQVPEVL